ncbi:MAG: SusC/RagA family TonB-linked outer membrane protein [Chitinophagaceae bacterium]|nr:MAG: SusC/RagA family TonB-linked outer membrane protein [Chitinophagaceae bacterium]
MRKIILSILVLLGFVISASAQERTISGKITDDKGEPIPNVSVTVKGTQVGTSTNPTGDFTLSIPANAKTLVFSSVGVVSKELSIGSRTNYSTSLVSAASELQEVVVVGYSTTTKEAFTGAAKVVAGERLTNKSVSNVSQSLAGEVAGVRVINTSGQPGSAATVRIRGIGSVNGNRAPLYVVDGVPYSGVISAINPGDIANMTVLKDAAATAIYGSRGANGVIVITTRTGKGKKSFIEVDGKYGTNSQILPRYDVINSPEEYIGLSWESVYNRGVILGSANPEAYANANLFVDGTAPAIKTKWNMWNVPNNAATLIDPVTRQVRAGVTRKYDPEDWSDFAFQASTRTEGNVRMGGGEGKTHYYTSFGYLKDEGYIVNTNFERLNARINLSHEVKPWLNTVFNIGYANTTTNNNGQAANSNSVFWFNDNIPSIYPLFLRDATGAKVPDPIFGGFQYDYGVDRGFGGLTNAIADATLNTLRAKRNELTGNASINIKFNKNLTLENRLGIQYYNNASVTRNNKFYGSAASQNGSIGQTKTELMNVNFLTMLRYAKRFGAHNVEALAAHESTDFKQNIAGASGYNLIDNYSLDLNNAIVINPTASSYNNTNKLESYFAQVNYDYKGTYYLSGTVRRDGSSKFRTNKWGTFGSIGAGWVISKMNFMNNAGPLRYLKLKASYGLTGDQDGLLPYPGYDRVNIGNLNNLPSFGVPTPGSLDLTWETSKMFQAGIDFELGEFLSGSIDYYVKNTDDLLFDRRIGISSGFALKQVNDGQLRNQGIEFDLTAHIVKKKDFYLDLGINGEHFTNKIMQMPLDPSDGFKPKLIDVQGNYAWAQGRSVYDFYLRNYMGVNPTTGVSMWTVYYDDLNNNNNADAGETVTNLEIFYKENPGKKGSLKTDTTNNYAAATQYYNGKSGLPKLRGAFNLNAGIKGFELSVQLLYSFGGYAYDGAYAGLMGNGQIGGNNWHTDIRNRWQKAGDITDVPRLSNNQDANVNSASTRFLKKADYLALNNVRLAYNIPESLLSRAGGFVQQASLFVSGDNLWLHSARNGFNPSTAETGSSDTYRYSPLSTITVGVKARF